MKSLPITLSETTPAYLKRKGFPFLKVELEANLNRNMRGGDDTEYCEYCDDGYVSCEEPEQECNTCQGSGSVTVDIVNSEGVFQNTETIRCDDCDGRGWFQCEEDHRCDECDGSGILHEGNGSEAMTDSYCRMFILNNVSPEARNSVVYSRFYYDGSVDSEFTFTIPVEAAKYLPEFIRAFKMLGDDTGTLDTARAGMHIAILRTGVYPCTKELDQDKLTNFVNEMPKLMPALFFLASANHKSRELGYRLPRIGVDAKYSAIHVFRGGMEYRVFETCYDRPEMILQFVEVIAKTLKFYGKAKIKRDMFKQFTFSECENNRKAYVARFFDTPEKIAILDKGLSLLAPNGTTVDELKRLRNFKPNFNPNKAEAKLHAEYIKWATARRESLEIEFHQVMRDKLGARYRIERDSIFDITVNNDKLKSVYKAYRQQYDEQKQSIWTFNRWLSSRSSRVSGNNYSVTIP